MYKTSLVVTPKGAKMQNDDNNSDNNDDNDSNIDMIMIVIR